jgi:hypothetical protein
MPDPGWLRSAAQGIQNDGYSVAMHAKTALITTKTAEPSR